MEQFKGSGFKTKLIASILAIIGVAASLMPPVFLANHYAQTGEDEQVRQIRLAVDSNKDLNEVINTAAGPGPTSSK